MYFTKCSSVAAICHKSLPPSILLSSLPSRGLPNATGLGRARSPAAKHSDAMYAVKQPYEIHIDV